MFSGLCFVLTPRTLDAQLSVRDSVCLNTSHLNCRHVLLMHISLRITIGLVSAVRPSWGQTAAVMWGLVPHPFFWGISTSLWLSLCCHSRINLIMQQKLRELTAVFLTPGCIFKPGTYRLPAEETSVPCFGCWSQHGLLAVLLKLFWNCSFL